MCTGAVVSSHSLQCCSLRSLKRAVSIELTSNLSHCIYVHIDCYGNRTWKLSSFLHLKCATHIKFKLIMKFFRRYWKMTFSGQSLCVHSDHKFPFIVHTISELSFIAFFPSLVHFSLTYPSAHFPLFCQCMKVHKTWVDESPVIRCKSVKVECRKKQFLLLFLPVLCVFKIS